MHFNRGTIADVLLHISRWGMRYPHGIRYAYGFRQSAKQSGWGLLQFCDTFTSTWVIPISSKQHAYSTVEDSRKHWVVTCLFSHCYFMDRQKNNLASLHIKTYLFSLIFFLLFTKQKLTGTQLKQFYTNFIWNAMSTKAEIAHRRLR